MGRSNGFYWIEWLSRPVAQVAEWSANQGWFLVGTTKPVADSDVRVLSEQLQPPAKA
jgi:hypothetical protein